MTWCRLESGRLKSAPNKRIYRGTVIVSVSQDTWSLCRRRSSRACRRSCSRSRRPRSRGCSRLEKLRHQVKTDRFLMTSQRSFCFVGGQQEDLLTSLNLIKSDEKQHRTRLDQILEKDDNKGKLIGKDTRTNRQRLFI